MPEPDLVAKRADGLSNAKRPSSHLGGILGPSLMISALSLMDTVFSFVYQLMVAHRFGARADMDAYLAAMTLPGWVILVFMTALNFSFVPVFVERMRTGRQEEAWRIANTLLTLVLLGFAGFSVVAFVFADRVVGLVAPGLPAGTSDKAVWLFRILVPGVIFQAAFSLLTNIHYALRSFAMPTIAPVVYVLVNIGILWVGAPTLGIGSVALGTTAGQVVEALVLGRILMRGREQLFCFRPSEEGVKQVARLMLPLVAVGLFRGTDVVEKFFASGLPEGSVSYLGYANKLLSPLSSILATGIVVSVFPRMAEQAATLGIEAYVQLRRTLSQSLTMMLFIMVPVAGWLAILRVPLVAVVLERGSFDHNATISVATAILFYLGYWVLSALANVLMRALLAFKDTVSVAAIELAGTAIFVFNCALLSSIMGFAGIALSRSLYHLAVVTILIVVVQHKVGVLPWSERTGSLVRIGASSGLSFAATSAVWALIGGESVHPLLQVLLPGAAGAAVYLAANWVLRTEELMAIQGLLLTKAISRLRKGRNASAVTPIGSAQSSQP